MVSYHTHFHALCIYFKFQVSPLNIHGLLLLTRKIQKNAMRDNLIRSIPNMVLINDLQNQKNEVQSTPLITNSIGHLNIICYNRSLLKTKWQKHAHLLMAVKKTYLSPV
jgi:hypothetical protein